MTSPQEIRVPTLRPVDHLKVRLINTSMVAVVVRKLSQWEIQIPATAKIQHTYSKHILQSLNSPLTLSLSPWIQNHVEVQSSTQLLVESLLGFLSKVYVLICNH